MTMLLPLTASCRDCGDVFSPSGQSTTAAYANITCCPSCRARRKAGGGGDTGEREAKIAELRGIIAEMAQEARTHADRYEVALTRNRELKELLEEARAAREGALAEATAG